MSNYWSCKFTFVIILFIFILSGCATDKGQAVSADFKLSAEAVPEGILLTFSNFPADAHYMWLHVMSLENEDLPISPYNQVTAYTSLTDSDNNAWHNSSYNLDTVKKTGKIIFPLLQTGVTYHFMVHVYNEYEFSNRMQLDNFMPCFAQTQFNPKNHLADTDILFNREDVKLALNDDHSAVSIISEPAFASGLIFEKQKYNFGINIIVDESRGIGVADFHYETGLSPDGLSWEFEPQMTATLKEQAAWLETGKYYSAWAVARVNVIYDDIRWSIEIAKSPEFKYSL